MKYFVKLAFIIFLCSSLNADTTQNYKQRLKIACTTALNIIYKLLAINLSFTALKNLDRCLINQTKKIVDGNIKTIQLSTMTQIKRFFTSSLIEATTAAGLFCLASEFSALTQKQIDKLYNGHQKPLPQFVYYKPPTFAEKNNTQESNPLTDGLKNAWMSFSMLIYLIRQCKILKKYISSNANSSSDHLVIFLFPFLGSACLYGIQKNTKSAYQNFKTFFNGVKRPAI